MRKKPTNKEDNNFQKLMGPNNFKAGRNHQKFEDDKRPFDLYLLNLGTLNESSKQAS